MSHDQPGAPRITAEEFQELARLGVPFVAQLGWRLVDTTGSCTVP